MADTLLTPQRRNLAAPTLTIEDALLRFNYLSEFQTESEKTVARHNLGVLAAEDVYTKLEIEPIIIDRIRRKIDEYSSALTYITPELLSNELSKFVRQDGTTPFTSTQTGTDPVNASELTTKRYVDNLIDACLKTSDKNRILNEVNRILSNYVQVQDVYSKADTYNKNEVNTLTNNVIKNDGTTPFKKPLVVPSPQTATHAANKAYVDRALLIHCEDIDPHNYTELLNNKLKKYALSETVWDKTQSYSRNQIDSIIDRLVATSINNLLKAHIDMYDPHNYMLKIADAGYVKEDGSTPFLVPLKGVKAVQYNELVTKEQLDDVAATLTNATESKECLWRTSGPTVHTVGGVEAGNVIGNTYTIQEIMDMIFYGQGVSLQAPDFGTIGDMIEVVACIHGGMDNVAIAELYVNGMFDQMIDATQFTNGCAEVAISHPINNDMTVQLKVQYNDGTIHVDSKTIQVSAPVYTLWIPYWKVSSTINMDYIENECLYQNPTCNQKHAVGHTVKYVQQNVAWRTEDGTLYVPCILIPDTYPTVKKIVTNSLTFNADDSMDVTTLTLHIANQDIAYKIYKYKQGIAFFNSQINYLFVQ